MSAARIIAPGDRVVVADAQTQRRVRPSATPRFAGRTGFAVRVSSIGEDYLYVLLDATPCAAERAELFSVDLLRLERP